MKKFVLSAMAAGALAVSGAASAQGFPDILGSLFGLTSQSSPAVVAGAPGTTYTDQYGRRIQVDQYGRHVVIDQHANTYGGSYGARAVYDSWGRPIHLDQHGTYVDRFGVRMHVDTYGQHHRLDRYGSYRDSWGRTVYLGADRRPLYVEHNGQLSAFVSNDGRQAYSSNPSWDRDGDGVPNHRDRWPDDPRYW